MIQYLLNANGTNLAVDSYFGCLTETAVEEFQRSHGLMVDGIVGDRTWQHLIVEVSLGSTGSAVKAIQDQINGHACPGLAVDGVFGTKTDNAVRRLQADFGLRANGIVGATSWNASLVQSELMVRV